MTYKEAIKIIRGFERLHYGKPNGDADLEVYEALSMAREALEKQKPKKPRYNHDDKLYHCPKCGSELGDDYCGACGQAIDWS